MAYIAAFNEMKLLNNNANNQNSNFNSVPELTNKLPKDFLFPKHNFTNNRLIASSYIPHSHVSAGNPLMTFQKFSLKNILKQENQNNQITKETESPVNKEIQQKNAAKTIKSPFEEKNLKPEKELINNLLNENKKNEESVKFKPVLIRAKQEETKNEKEKTFDKFSENTLLTEQNKTEQKEDKAKLPLNKNENQEKQIIQQNPDNKAAERQVAEFLNAQKFAKDESKKAQDKDKAKKQTEDALDKIGEERKKVKRKKKGGQNNSLNNEIEDNTKKPLKILLANKTSNNILLVLFLLFAFVAMFLMAINIF